MEDDMTDVIEKVDRALKKMENIEGDLGQEGEGGRAAVGGLEDGLGQVQHLLQSRFGEVSEVG